jgi:glucose-1-phosphate adenylyltransferase
MGNYIFTTDVLIEALKADAEDADSDHDMGGDIIPRMVRQGDAHVYDFAENDVPGATERDAGYWRDVGTIDAYYEAHTDLVSVHPIFNLYNMRWPIRTAGARCRPPSSWRAASRRTRSSARARSSPGRSCAVR